MKIVLFFKYFLLIFIILKNTTVYSENNFPSEIEILIKGSNYKDFLKQFSIMVTNSQRGLVNPSNIKKPVKAEVNWESHEDVGKVRLTGDYWNDHVDLKKNISSIFVSLEKKNISGITKFKLFLPSARQYLNEIFATTFLEEFGFLVPKTKLIKVKLNNKSYFAIFQEHPTKELIERNNYKDGIILEGNEDMYYFNNYFKKITNPLCCFSKIDNFSIIKNNHLNKKILYNALTKYSSQVYKNPLQSNYHYNFLAFNNNDYSEFDEIMEFIGADHGISINNRKFYYDAFYNRLMPIYYDGDVSMKFNYEKKSYLKYSHINSIVNAEKFKENFINKINSKIDKEYIHNNEERYLNFISKIEEMIKKIKLIAIEYKKKNQLINKIVKINPQESVSIIATDKFQSLNILNFKNNDFEFCEVISKKTLSMNCNPISKKISYKILSNNKKYINKRKQFPQTIGFIKGIFNQNEIDKLNKKKFNKENNIFKNKKIVLEQKFKKKIKFLNLNLNKLVLKKDFIYVLQSDHEINLNLKLDYSKLGIVEVDDFPKIVMIGKFKKINLETKTENLKIENTSKFNDIRYDERQLTGCINIIDATFEKLDVEINDMPCEDGLNIIRSVGKIDKLKIKNSISDALDLDFSKIVIKNLEILNSGNDCVDLSSGNYKIENLKVKSCGDKGVSVGEKAELDLNNGDISDVNMGIASKDLSKVTVNNKIFVSGYKSCFETYQKKQEFGVGFFEFKIEEGIKCN